ncbi:universal stress protein [Neolewinella persica]|uniref:universal stress protein n=1 Tax=Neolewinella persica TaxID=70998 RepID=UPI00037981DC|nr:universal stress protein [Neolewinella persica]
MKHILVGIDFSKPADRALAYAEEIALVMNSKISLVYVLDPSKSGSKDNTASAAELEKQLTELAESIGQRGITTAAYLYEGAIVPTLRRVIDDGDCDLVVMGCQGEHFQPDDPWGSTTTSLMEDTRIPILAVPSYAPVKYPRRFMLAADKECPRNLRQLSPLLQLLDSERTQLLLFHYLQSTERAMPDKAYARLLTGVEYRFYYQVDEHHPVGNAVVGFADLTAADIVVVTHRAEHLLGNKATGSVARRVTGSATIPILILQDSY